ncbi:unnamed protein product [Caenorhabditis nigoni]
MSFAMKYFIAMLLMAIASNAQYGLYQTPGPLADQQRSFSGSRISDHSAYINSYDYDYYHNPSNYHRFYRAATNDTVSLAVERMQMMARLTNAISLQKQLINGTVDPDKLISELLHFGSISPSQIHAIKFSNVTSALKLLKDLPSKLKDEPVINDLENCFKQVNDILKHVEGLEKASNWPEKVTFTDDINNLVGGKGGDFSVTKNLQSALNLWIAFHSRAEQVQDNTAFTSDDSKHLVDLAKESTNILEAGKNLATQIPNLFKFADDKNATKSVEFLGKVANGVAEVRKQAVSFPTNGISQLKDQLTQITDVVTTIKAVRENIDLITNLYISRANKEKRANYTLALPNGYDDVTRLLGHFDNPWFLQTVKDRRLAESLKSLKAFETANVIEKLLQNQVSSDKIAGSMSDIVSISLDLKTTFGSVTLDNTKQIMSCIKSGNTRTAPDDINALINTADKIDKKLEGFQATLNELKTKLNDPTLIKNLKAFIALGEKVDKNNPNTWPVAFAEFKKMESMQETVTSVEGLKGSANSLNFKDLQDLAREAQPRLDSFDVFITGNPEQVSTLDCLLTTADTKATVKAITDSERIRNSATEYKDKVEKAIEVLKSVESTKKDLKTLETSIKGIKNFTSPESDLLFSLKNDKELSKTIGSSANAIGGMKKAIDAKENIDAMKAEFGIMTAEAKNAKSLSADDKKNLEELAGTSLDKMFTGLDSWKSGLSGLNFPNLTSYEQVFSKAKKVTALSFDVAKTRKSLKKLIDEVTDPSKKDKLKKVKDGLDALDGMGMQFSSYAKSFDGATSALELLEEFFSSFTKTISVTRRPPQNIIYANTGGPIAQKKDSLWWIYTWWGILILFFVGVIVFGSLATGIYFLAKPKKIIKNTLNVIGQNILQQQTRVVGDFSSVELTEAQFTAYIESFKLDIAAANDIDVDSSTFRKKFKELLRNWLCKVYDEIDVAMKEGIKKDPKLKKGQQGDISKFVQDHRKEVMQEVELKKKTRIIMPLDHELVKFDTDFFHGNYILMENQFNLMICQGPHLDSPKGDKISTMNKFWFNIHNEKAQTILMLCQCVEEGRKKCDQYFPSEENETKVFGPFTIKCTKKVVDNQFIIRSLTLFIENHEPQHISHYQYIGWPDQSVPEDVTQLIRYWKIIRNSNKGVVIHCSAGIGRSGSVAYVEMLYQEIAASENGKIAQPMVFFKLRDKRARAIQSPLQFIFCNYLVFELMYSYFDPAAVTKSSVEFMTMLREAWNQIRVEPMTQQQEKKKGFLSWLNRK